MRTRPVSWNGHSSAETESGCNSTKPLSRFRLKSWWQKRPASACIGGTDDEAHLRPEGPPLTQAVGARADHERLAGCRARGVHGVDGAALRADAEPADADDGRAVSDGADMGVMPLAIDLFTGLHGWAE